MITARLYPWHNQACARCGVTAELHRTDYEGYEGGPMLPTQPCDEFVWSAENYEAATPIWVKLERRIAKLEENWKRTPWG